MDPEYDKIKRREWESNRCRREIRVRKVVKAAFAVHMLPSDARSFRFHWLIEKNGIVVVMETQSQCVGWWRSEDANIPLALHLLLDRAKVEWLVNNLELPDFDTLEGLSFGPKALLVLRRYRPSAFSTFIQDSIQVPRTI